MKRIYASMDIGTDTIKIVVTELYKNKLNLLAATSSPSKGIKKGLITDIDDAKDSVRAALFKIEDMLGFPLKRLIVTIPSYFAEFNIVTAEVPILNEEKIVTGNEVVQVVNEALKKEIDPLREIVTILPIDFKVGEQITQEPKGLYGNTLYVRAVLVTTPKKNVYSVVGLLETMGVEVTEISLGSIGDIYAFKNKKTFEQIGVVINIGSQTTTVSILNKGIVIRNSILQLGGENIDSDIAYIYKTDLETARHLKENFAMAHKNYASTTEIREITNRLEETVRVNQLELSEIVSSRIEQILNLAKKEINGLAKRPIDYIIVTGGTSNIPYFDRITEEVLGSSATVGQMKLIGIRNNKYSSCLGNIVYFIYKLKLKGKNYTMISESDEEIVSSNKKNTVNELRIWKAYKSFLSE